MVIGRRKTKLGILGKIPSPELEVGPLSISIL